jgi:siroheme synthase (precorrin-2 oxidase/ferrochelatase)
LSDAADAPPFYPVSLNLAGRRCVVIGASDDREAIEKERDLREAGADVAWITDPAGLRDDDVADAFFVIATPQDTALAARLRALADRYRFLLCAIDQPAYNSVAMAAIVKAGPARVAISTGGVAPRVGGTLRAALQRALDERFVRFLGALAQRRRSVRADHPADAAARRAAMIAAAEGFAVDVHVAYPAWFLDEVAAAAPAAGVDS